MQIDARCFGAGPVHQRFFTHAMSLAAQGVLPAAMVRSAPVAQTMPDATEPRVVEGDRGAAGAASISL